MEVVSPDNQQTMLQEQLAQIGQLSQTRKKWGEHPQTPSLWSSKTYQVHPLSDPNRHRFNHYADKQLNHLVLAQQFDFTKIAGILNYVFRDERSRFTEVSCRQRWHQLYVLRVMGQAAREKKMQDKRASSVSSFSDPFSLYNLDEMLDKLQKTQKVTQQQTFTSPVYSGYNIFKNSIRQIDDMQSYFKRQKQMQNALKLAQTSIVTDKLMHFQPYYDRLNEFQVKEEELTEEKMKQIMSRPIEIERMEKELKVKDMNQNGENGGKKVRREEKNVQSQERYDIQEDWDEYQSD